MTVEMRWNTYTHFGKTGRKFGTRAKEHEGNYEN